MLYLSAPLHDIGKVGIPDHILLKPGRLDASEFEIMKTHTTLGYQSILSATERLSGGSSFLTCAMEIALSHQEKWDGSGYPQGLAGDEIPISARLMAVADVFESMVSHRPYRPALGVDVALAELERGHADPKMLITSEVSLDAFPQKLEALRGANDDTKVHVVI